VIPAQSLSEISRDKRANDAENCGENETLRLITPGSDQFGKNACNKADKNRPKYSFLCSFVVSIQHLRRNPGWEPGLQPQRSRQARALPGERRAVPGNYCKGIAPTLDEIELQKLKLVHIKDWVSRMMTTGSRRGARCRLAPCAIATAFCAPPYRMRSSSILLTRNVVDAVSPPRLEAGEVERYSTPIRSSPSWRLWWATGCIRS